MGAEGLTAWRAYLYTVAFISLIVVILGAIDLLAILLEVFVYPTPLPYPQPPQYYYGLTRAAAMVMVGLVVWYYHWSKLQKEEKNPEKE